MVRYPALYGTAPVGCVWGQGLPVAHGRLVWYDVHRAEERGTRKNCGTRFAAAPSMLALPWVWRSSAYCYANMNLPMMHLWGHIEISPLALCATSRVATSPRPSNMQLAYMEQNLVLGRMISVLAASVPLALWHFPAAVLTAVASASSVGRKFGPCSDTFICSLERPCAASLRPCSRGEISTRSPRAAYLQFYQNLQTSQHASL